MNEQEIREGLEKIFPLNKLKPNPYEYPIINKWNRKYVYLPNRYKLFEYIKQVIDREVEERLNNGK